jgi:hypothetical protein
MHPGDIGVFRQFSARGLLFVVRCPKVTARVWHGALPPKRMVTKDKTGTSGVVVIKPKKDESGKVVAPAQMWVSDYDLMSVWRKVGSAYTKVFMSAAKGADRGPWAPEATQLALELNLRLVSRLQHGCQDDYHSSKNPGVKPGDHFAAFVDGTARHLANMSACSSFYKECGLKWSYGPRGEFLGAVGI